MRDERDQRNQRNKRNQRNQRNTLTKHNKRCGRNKVIATVFVLVIVVYLGPS